MTQDSAEVVRRSHLDLEEDCWFSCATLTCDDGRRSDVCDCGADAANASLDSLLDRLAKAEQQIEEMHLAMAEAIRRGMKAEQERDEAKAAMGKIAATSHMHVDHDYRAHDYRACGACVARTFLNQETKR
jgi:hypothetical protein